MTVSLDRQRALDRILKILALADGTSFEGETSMVGGVPADTSSLELLGPDYASVFEPLQDMLCDPALVILSIIADSRSPVTRVVADDKLNKSRVKSGKAPFHRTGASSRRQPCSFLAPNRSPRRRRAAHMLARVRTIGEVIRAI